MSGAAGTGGSKHRRSPSADHDSSNPSPNLWVGNLTADTNDKDLAALFGKYGPIDSVTAYTPKNNYAFVYFKHLDDAKLARDTLQGALVRGNPLKIDFAKPAKPCKHLWIGGISQTVTRDDIKEQFSKFGEIEDLKLIKDRNSALVEYRKIEDASEAIKSMNGKILGGEQIRVDFVRSQPGRRDFLEHDSWMPSDLMRNIAESSQHGLKRPLMQGRREWPSKILLIRYPPTVLIDEQMLHNAMILFGEIERIKSFPGRHHAFVEFRSVDEARRAKEGLQGRLFNDPRIQILFSHNELSPAKEGSPFFMGRGPRPDMFFNEPPFGMMDMVPPGPLIGPNNFLGPPHGFDPIHGRPEFNHKFADGNSMPWRRSSPPGVLHSAPAIQPHFRPMQRPWDDIDARGPKRSRLDGPVNIDDVPNNARIGDSHGPPILSRNAVGNQVHSPARMMGAVAGGSKVPKPQGIPRRDHSWRGVIAKGGTAVCHARCIPIGKGISSPLPEVVNCSARTGLDMLSKHYAEASGFDIVFFLPDSEEDFASYTEFLRYLGVKNRAGVAKLDDGTTLFLVPPSDFLFNVLNVSGPERLYGVVLKLAQPSVSATAQPPQAIPTQTVQYADRRPLPPSSYGLTSQVDNHTKRVENNKAVLEGSMHHASSENPPLQHAEEARAAPPVSLNYSTNLSGTSNVEFSLTPELLATLASLVPNNASSAPGAIQLPSNPPLSSHPAPAISGKAMPAQGWHQEHSAPGGSVHGEQIIHPPIQLVDQSSNRISVSQFPNYGNAVNPSDHSTQVFPSSGETYVPPTNMQQVAEVGNYAYPSQSANYSVNPHNHQYQVNNAYTSNSGNYGVAQTSDVGGVLNQFIPQSISSVPNQTWALAQPQEVMPSVSDNVNAEFPAQLQQLHAALTSSSQGAGVSEAEKNQRYQSTLQFAASLLMQIQQQGSAQSLQGSEKQQ